MKTKLTGCTLFLSALWVTPLGAYDTLKQDFGTCLQSEGKATNPQIVAACTRLIDNAKAENELIGFAYAMRAASNSDKASNCRDARKAVQLITAPAAIASANKIIESDC